ncbi:UDP-N-acetylglucosamine--N-acetylmuramyl-(pentapeptide) pyrophosphoryl-undecaprenol N-acetylglucosamine transferase [Dysgonomonadaceae bacterium PH5-43]|nr:UDP-N-acetylglucosamine--N-acetylmuramyl-(pentapeptide) pyrophosphoryl-undecaprenol N-acetylglucosamine transferase [Dysgonomonadaceae bacterium PH5-43]
MKKPKVIISGGGTGGHIFPAISIANAIREKYSDAEILFVGAENKMEMEKVPAAGYNIKGLPVAGLDRKNLLKNISVLFKFVKSMYLANKIIKSFNPDIAIGVGGYASGPTLKAASRRGVPTLLQEQNSFAGVTNKLLAKKAAKICVAYEGMEQFFEKDKIVLTGNPVRQDLVCLEDKRQEAYSYFSLNPQKKTILVVGGSGGARTINESIIAALPELSENKDIQIIWQSGKYYYSSSKNSLEKYSDAPVKLTEFISRMDLAYAAADIIISRAGAGSISEFCLLGKPVVLVPSPNVAEDHQRKNAMALINKGAAIMVEDKDAVRDLIPTTIEAISNNELLDKLSINIKKLALPDSAKMILKEIENIITK